jgi:hypothetical protein
MAIRAILSNMHPFKIIFACQARSESDTQIDPNLKSGWLKTAKCKERRSSKAAN